MELYSYQYYHASKIFQFNQPRLNGLVSIINAYHPKTVLDVGCGLGALVRELQKQNIQAYGVDSAIVLKSIWGKDVKNLSIAPADMLPFADQSFDIVFSSDFFEHIPEEEIESVRKEMIRVGKVVLARVAYEDKLTKKQALYHVTNKKKEWWEDKLQGVILV